MFLYGTILLLQLSILPPPLSEIENDSEKSLETKIISVTDVYKPNECSNCSLFIGQISDLLQQVRNSNNFNEKLDLMKKVENLTIEHAENNEVAYASGQLLTEAELFNLFGTNKDEFIKSIKDELQVVDNILKNTNANSNNDTESLVYGRLLSLQTELSDLLIRFNPSEKDLVSDDPRWLPYQQFVYYITGIWPTPGNEIAIANRMESDHYVIKQKYGLPNRDIEFINPIEYLNQLLKIAKDNNISIRPGSEYQAFFDEYSRAGGYYDDIDKKIVIPLVDKNDKEMLLKYVRVLEHELIHALQDQKYPGMPIEALEYEAYIGANMGLGYLKANPLRAIDRLFMNFMRGSIDHWYNDKNIDVKPWINLKAPSF